MRTDNAPAVVPTIRPARLDDAEAVASFTEDTWPDHGGDYVPRVFESWVEEMDDGEGGGDGTGGDHCADARTLVATDGDDRPIGLLRTALLSPTEAWCGGMRVAPDRRGEGVAVRLSDAAFDWARGRGASVARCMVFSWNVAGLGAARAAGFEPETEFRWAHPTPATGEARTEAPSDARAGSTDDVDPDPVWTFWRESEACDHLGGLALDPTESWALSTLTRDRLATAAADGRLLAVSDETGAVAGFAVRVRVTEPASGAADGADPERWAEYAVAAWADAPAAGATLDAVARDAAVVCADRTRVLIPETVRAVSDAALARVEVAESPDFVLVADQTERD